MREKLIDPKYNVHKKYRQMNLVDPYRLSPPANTFIGGVSATINTAALVASKLGISSSRIKSFSIIGANIEFAVIGGTYAIASGAFNANTSLTYYNDASGLVTQINAEAFFGCTNATSYTFPALTTITSSGGGGGFASIGTFRNNTSLTSFAAPLLTTVAGWNNFRGNSALTTFNCPLLTTLTVGGFNFYQLTNLSYLTIGKLTRLGDSEFYQCSKITSIDLSEVITISGSNHFQLCALLTNIVNINKIPTISANMFHSSGVAGAITANLATSIGQEAFFGCSGVTSYSFPIVTTIASGAGSFGSVGAGTFRGNASLTTFSAPLLTTITGWSAFRGNGVLTTINCPLLTTLNGGCTFYSLANLNSLTIGKLTYVGANEFENCVKITFIDLSEVVTVSGGSQFSGCTLLAGFVNINKMPTISNAMFNGTAIAGAITANLATSIGIDAFYLCNKVTSYSFPIVTTITGGGISSGSTTGTFRTNSLMTSFSAPLLTSVTGWNVFRDAGALVTFYTPNLATLGASVLDNSTFTSIKTGCTITVKTSLATANAGAPDGDLVYAVGTRSAVVTYV